MNIVAFVEKFPYLYHLTCAENARNIINDLKLYSANSLIDMSSDAQAIEFKSHKRLTHKEITINGRKIFLRDQRPISEVALAKCLTDNWTIPRYLKFLNERVFMWPTINRLERHFKRYAHEKPVIFRFSTKEMIEENSHVKFCRLNSGATRPNSYLGGIAPERGKNSFLAAQHFNHALRDVAEVTFEKECAIVGPFGIDFNPYGNFREKI